MRDGLRFVMLLLLMAGPDWVGAAEPVQPQAPSNVPPAVQGLRPFREVEQQYLDGQITARQFQKYLQRYVEELNKNRSASTNAIRKVRVEEKDSAAHHVPTPPPATASPVILSAHSTNAPAESPIPKLTQTEAAPLPEARSLEDIERRMQKLLEWKANREKERRAAAALQGPNQSQTVQDKVRLQLNRLIRRYIEGEITQREYQKQRSELLQTQKTP